jgi:hypothetical protein
MNPFRLFEVILSDPKKTNGKAVRLPLLRTEDQVAELRRHGYAIVQAREIETPGLTDSYQETTGRAFRQALVALVACYRQAEKDGDKNLAARAQKATAALIGYQKHLRSDDGQPFQGDSR